MKEKKKHSLSKELPFPSPAPREAGVVEVAVFDPRTSCGEIKAVSCSADGRFLKTLMSFRETGGIVRWNGDVRPMALFDRYVARRQAIVARCPAPYPIPDVQLVRGDAGVGRVNRLLHQNADLLGPYAEKYAAELEVIALQEGGDAVGRGL